MYITYFDGVCEPINPGGTASYGAVIFENDQQIWKCSELYIPPKGREHETSNNIAEYSALIAVLEWFTDQEMFDAEILVHGDSKLVIEQTFGRGKIKQGLYVPLAYRARELCQGFSNLWGRVDPPGPEHHR